MDSWYKYATNPFDQNSKSVLLQHWESFSPPQKKGKIPCAHMDSCPHLARLASLRQCTHGLLLFCFIPSSLPVLFYEQSMLQVIVFILTYLENSFCPNSRVNSSCFILKRVLSKMISSILPLMQRLAVLWAEHAPSYCFYMDLPRK